jgi:hypothetical protein
MSDVDRNDLQLLRDSIIDEMRAGFRGVHQRQDVTNGRLLKAEAEVTRHSERIKTLFRISDRRRTEAGGVEENRRLTQRDVRIFSAGGGAVLAAFYFIKAVLPLLRGL